MRRLLALTVAAVGVLTALISGAGAASAADKPSPLHIPKITLPKLGAAKATHPTVPKPAAPSHPLTVTLPGLATVSVNLPDLPTVLGGGRHAAGRTTAEPEATAPAPSTGAVAVPADPTGSEAPAPAATPAVPGGTTAASATRARPAAAARAHRTTTSGDQTLVGAVRPRHAAHKAHVAPASAPKPAARAVADAFQGMLHTGLPVWLLVGIVVMCGGGTVIVVRSGRRPTQAGRH